MEQSTVTLYNADCREVIEKIKADHSNLCIVTDPPFNIGYHYNSYKDKMKEKDYLEFVGGNRHNTKCNNSLS